MDLSTQGERTWRTPQVRNRQNTEKGEGGSPQPPPTDTAATIESVRADGFPSTAPMRVRVLQ